MTKISYLMLPLFLLSITSVKFMEGLYFILSAINYYRIIKLCDHMNIFALFKHRDVYYIIYQNIKKWFSLTIKHRGDWCLFDIVLSGRGISLFV